jgi:hypothetical protein
LALTVQVAQLNGLEPVRQNAKQDMARQVKGGSSSPQSSSRLVIAASR